MRAWLTTQETKYEIKHTRSNNQRKRVGMPFTGLTPPHFCVCPKAGTEFSMPYVTNVMVFFAFNCKRREVIVPFVEIGGIVDHHYLNFPFHNTKWLMILTCSK